MVGNFPVAATAAYSDSGLREKEGPGLRSVGPGSQTARPRCECLRGEDEQIAARRVRGQRVHRKRTRGFFFLPLVALHPPRARDYLKTGTKHTAVTRQRQQVERGSIFSVNSACCRRHSPCFFFYFLCRVVVARSLGCWCVVRHALAVHAISRFIVSSHVYSVFEHKGQPEDAAQCT